MYVCMYVCIAYRLFIVFTVFILIMPVKVNNIVTNVVNNVVNPQRACARGLQ